MFNVNSLLFIPDEGTFNSSIFVQAPNHVHKNCIVNYYPRELQYLYYIFNNIYYEMETADY